MKIYAALLVVGLALVVTGFLWDDANWITIVGFLVGAAGFIMFVRNSQTSKSAPGRFDT